MPKANHKHSDLFFLPKEYFGSAKGLPLGWSEMEWLRDLPGKVYCAMYITSPVNGLGWPMLPQGYDLYVIGFFHEKIHPKWISDQFSSIKQPIIVLNDGSVYDFLWPDHAEFFPYHCWHYQTSRMMHFFPNRRPRKPIKKVSAFCNRITQSKIFTFMAIMRYVGIDCSILRLGLQLEEKNVHYRQSCGNPLLDDLQQEFFENWYGKEIIFDGAQPQDLTIELKNGDPWNKAYIEAALHFTNESYAYSLMHDEFGQYIRPGPCLSEKTFKCLVAGTPFISVAQFEVYKNLIDLGFEFDYGSLDLSWDWEPGNITRMAKIVELIRQVGQMDLPDIVGATTNSSDHNLDHVWSGKFEKICRARNQSTVETILAKFS